MNRFDRLQKMATEYCNAACSIKENISVAVEEFILNMYGLNSARYWVLSQLSKPHYQIVVTGGNALYEVTLMGLKSGGKIQTANGGYQRQLSNDITNELKRKFSGVEFKTIVK